MGIRTKRAPRQLDSDQALSHVMRSIMAESPNAMDEAFRYEFGSITGGGRPVDIRVNIDGVEFEARSVSGDMGFVTGQTDLYLDTDAKLLAVKALEGKAMRMLIQVGTSPGFPDVFALWLAEVEVTGVDFGDDAGAQTATVQWRCTYDSTSTLARWTMGIG